MSLAEFRPSPEDRISSSSPLHETDGPCNNGNDSSSSPRIAISDLHALFGDASDLPTRQKISMARVMVPSGFEVIDLDSIPDPSPFVKNEPIDLDVIEVKAEPDDENLRSFGSTLFQWTNSADEPILIDDDDDPPEPVLKQLSSKTSPPKTSPPVESMVAQYGDTTNPKLQELSPAPSITDKMDVDTIRTLNAPRSPITSHTPTSDSNTTPPTVDVNPGSSVVRTRTKVGGHTSSSFRDKLKAAQQQARVAIITRQNPVPQAEPEVQSPIDDNTLSSASNSERHTPVQKDSNHANEDDMDLDSDREYERECTRFETAKKAHEERERAGKSSMEEDIQFMQLTAEHDARQRKRKEDKQRDQEEVLPHDDDLLFEPTGMDIDDVAINARLPSEDEIDELYDEDEHRQQKGRSSKKVAKSKALEDESIAVVLEEELRGKRKQKKSKADNGSKNAKSSRTTSRAKTKTSNDKVKDPKAKVLKKSKHQAGPKNKGPSMMDMGSLFTSNVVRDAQGNENRAPLATLTSAKKNDALKALVASVPPDIRKTAQVDRSYLLSATRDFIGRGSVRSVPGAEGWHLKGMKSLLKHHQLLGAAFMRRRERGDDTPKGGLCADQMGLGKTVMMLANIINGRPGPKDPGPKTTLIVATPALVTQWFDEIEKHCENPKSKKLHLNVLKYFGKFKFATNRDAAALLDFDIVLTTYDEVRKSYPKAEFPAELQTAEEKSMWWQAYYLENRGLLHEVEFLRVVLDEAQQIKNHKSWTSIAARGLMAHHRWALSGTPIQNSPKELYPYFKFLRVQHTGSFRIFCANFIGADGLTSQGLNRLHTFLSRFMIRRTHLDQLMGAPLVTLPKASEKLVWCKFNDFERAVYEIVRKRMVQRINQLSQSKQLDSQYSSILTMLLRLRQLTGHILTVEGPMRDLLEREDHEKIFELAQHEANAKRMPERSAHLQRLRNHLALQLHSSSNDTHPQATQFPGVDINGQGEEREKNDRPNGSARAPKRMNIGRHHGLQFDFLQYLASLREKQNWDELQSRTVCVSCNDKPENPWVTSCFHIYCQDCLNALQESSAARDQDKARCTECGVIFNDAKPCDGFSLETLEQTSSFASDSDGEHLKKNRPKDKGEHRDWIDLAGTNILPSSKTIAIKAQILNWVEENPDVKIIIYTQFIDMIRILRKVCQVEGWKYSTYHGGKSHETRDKVIKDFSEDPELRVLIASLKAGGIGLNLTMAQKVIVVDPWWNSSVEQQAFCRVFRIGQEQETSMTRFVVEKTVDENMIKMQERKQTEIDEVMDGNKRKKLTIPELLRLFGDVDEDEDGQPFILVDDKEILLNPIGNSDDEQLDEV